MWKTAPAAITESATWDLLNRAVVTETSPRSSLGSEAPRKAIAPAAPGGYKIAIIIRSGKPTLRVSPRQVGTGKSSTPATKAAHNNQRGSKCHPQLAFKPMTSATVATTQIAARTDWPRVWLGAAMDTHNAPFWLCFEARAGSSRSNAVVRYPACPPDRGPPTISPCPP